MFSLDFLARFWLVWSPIFTSYYFLSFSALKLALNSKSLCQTMVYSLSLMEHMWSHFVSVVLRDGSLLGIVYSCRMFVCLLLVISSLYLLSPSYNLAVCYVCITVVPPFSSLLPLCAALCICLFFFLLSCGFFSVAFSLPLLLFSGFLKNSTSLYFASHNLGVSPVCG